MAYVYCRLTILWTYFSRVERVLPLGIYIVEHGLNTLFQNAEASRDPAAVDDVANRLRRELEAAVQDLSNRLAGLWYPFPHALGRRRITELLAPEASPANDIHRAYLLGLATLQNLPPLYTRCLARLVILALQAEQKAGLAICGQ